MCDAKNHYPNEKIMNKIVKDKFEAYPNSVREKMLSLRKLIYKVAKETNGVGELEETLKWGEPSYLTSKTKSGTTIRIDWKRKNPDQYAIYLKEIDKVIKEKMIFVCSNRKEEYDFCKRNINILDYKRQHNI